MPVFEIRSVKKFGDFGIDILVDDGNLYNSLQIDYEKLKRYI